MEIVLAVSGFAVPNTGYVSLVSIRGYRDRLKSPVHGSPLLDWPGSLGSPESRRQLHPAPTN